MLVIVKGYFFGLFVPNIFSSWSFMLHLILVTIMLWDRYLIDCLKFLKEWSKKWDRKGNSLFWATTALFPCATNDTHISNAPCLLARSGVAASYLFTKGGAPIAPHVFLIKSAMLDLWRKKREVSRGFSKMPSWNLIPMNQDSGTRIPLS